MDSYYEEVPLEKIKLDHSNPRIATIIEKYGENVPAEAISLALGSGSSEESNSTTFAGLKESIKTNGGIIHPIILNKINEDEYVAIEGNTRVQIYIEFKNNDVSGKWDNIRAIVYDRMSDEQIHAIRLQSHLVGPRAWGAYEKAKYLSYLSNKEKMSYNELISYCGGNRNNVIIMINAYSDMEMHYRPQLRDDDMFDQKKFSFFKELQSRGATTALQNHGYTKKDYAKWVINGNLDLSNIAPRRLGAILDDPKAKEEFLRTNATNALAVMNGFKGSSPLNVEIGAMAAELSNKLLSITWPETKKMITAQSSDLDCLLDLKATLEDYLGTVDSLRDDRD